MNEYVTLMFQVRMCIIFHFWKPTRVPFKSYDSRVYTLLLKAFEVIDQRKVFVESIIMQQNFFALAAPLAQLRPTSNRIEAIFFQ